MVGVGGEFPLSDDWAYAHAVRSLCGGGGLDLLPWTGASLLAQAAYGAVACKLFGFSFEMLRLTTVALSLVGILATYLLLSEAGANQRLAAAGAALVAFSPPWLNLSLTFMTDVPFAALATLAAALYARGFRRGSRRLLFAASAIASIAFLIRQHGVFAPAAAALVALVATPLPAVSRRRWQAGEPAGSAMFARCADTAAVAGLPLLVAAAYAIWVAGGHGVPLALRIKMGEATTTPLPAVANAAFRGIVTTGFLLLPWALAQRPASRQERRLLAVLASGLGAAALFLYLREGALMFYLPNALYDFGLGAVTLRDALFLNLPVLPRLGPLLAVPLTLASIASAAMLGVAMLSRVLPMLRSPVAAFCLAATALTALGTLGQSAYYFDRYLLAVLPLAMASMVAVARDLRLGAAFFASLGLMAIYAVAGTHDYMEWNRARWHLLNDLEARGVSAEAVDGGMEYNAERLAARLRTAPTDAQARRGQAASVKSWWWVVDDEWIVAFAPLDGYQIAETRSFPRWLDADRGQVVLLHRNAASTQSD